jgi:hypothetical protein
MSQRKIADIVGCGQKTVSRLLGESKPPMAEMTQEETPELEGVAKRPMAEMQHEENPELEGGEKPPMAEIPQEEDTTSVFTHCTSVEPVANPWVCLTI